MNDMLSALLDPNMAFLRYAVIAGLFSSVAFGIVGTYVVARRISYVAGAISHSVLGGIGAALYLQAVYGWVWCDPIAGAIVVALLSALVIGTVNMYAKQREDSVIGAIWAIGMAAGLVFIARTPGYIDAMSYLFGNILLLTRVDLWTVLALDAVVVVTALLFHGRLMAVCFDEEFARARGIHVGFYYMILLCLTALTVVLLVRVVGIVMVIALLTLPSAVASVFSKRLWQMMVLSILFCAVFTVVGLAVSFHKDLPSGPVIILIAGAAYLVVVSGSRLFRRALR